MNNIYLVGFMGTGKSAVAREIARQKKWDFVDIDELIEKEEKRGISDIFAQNGELHFRKLEKETLAKICTKDKQVVSCGGGIVLDKENIDIIKQTGIMVCLTASPEVILERTRVFKHRPLLNVENPKAKIESLLKERAAYYALADKTVDTSGLSIKETAAQILEYLS